MAQAVTSNAPAPFDIQRRAYTRLIYREPCLFQTDARGFHAKSINISEGGICVRVQGLGFVKNGTAVALMLEDFAPIDAIIRWSRDRVFGMQFITQMKDHPQLEDLITRLSKVTPGEAEAEKPNAVKIRQIDETDELVAAYDHWDLSKVTPKV